MTNHIAHSTRNRKANTGSASSKTMGGDQAKNEAGEGRRDVCQMVTDSIIKILEQGARPWAKSWKDRAGEGMTVPRRHTGERYRGINVLILWGAQEEAGYTSPYWMTFRQALELGGQVRKGCKGTMVCYYGSAPQKGEGDDSDESPSYRFLKTFFVFNAEQVDGLPERYHVRAAPAVPAAERIGELDAIVAATGARNGGNRAYFEPVADYVQMPLFEQFRSAECYYATLFHELAHWTKLPARLNRDFGSKMWGDEGYAKEELVAELTAAFLGAEYGFSPDHIEDHAAYLASWLKALKNDKRLIFTAAAKAQAAVDFLTAGAEQAHLAEAA